MAIELSEQEQLRRQSLTALRNLGIEPYPAARYEVTATAREIADNYDRRECIIIDWVENAGVSCILLHQNRTV